MSIGSRCSLFLLSVVGGGLQAILHLWAVAFMNKNAVVWSDCWRNLKQNYCPASPPVTNTYCHVCHRLPLVLPMPKKIQTQDNSHRCWWCRWWGWVLTCKDFGFLISIILPPPWQNVLVCSRWFVSLQIIGLLPKSSVSVWMRASLWGFWVHRRKIKGFWSLWNLGKLRTSGHVITKGTVLFHISFFKASEKIFSLIRDEQGNERRLVWHRIVSLYNIKARNSSWYSFLCYSLLTNWENRKKKNLRFSSMPHFQFRAPKHPFVDPDPGSNCYFDTATRAWQIWNAYVFHTIRLTLRVVIAGEWKQQLNLKKLRFGWGDDRWDLENHG